VYSYAEMPQSEKYQQLVEQNKKRKPESLRFITIEAVAK
jgi:hypothetical protein